MLSRATRATAAVLTVAGLGLAGCGWGGGGGGGVPTLNWYINPDNGGQKALAAKCTKAADGRYRIDVQLLPTDADGQRQQLVNRLAANDSSIDIMSLDPTFVPEFANAEFLRPFTKDEAAPLTKGVLDAPNHTVTWNDRVVAAPFWANTQLLWYRKSVARKAGLDLSQPVTWDQVIAAARKTHTTVEVQADLYEGYMVWINGLVTSGGGEVLKDPQAGEHARPAASSTPTSRSRHPTRCANPSRSWLPCSTASSCARSSWSTSTLRAPSSRDPTPSCGSTPPASTSSTPPRATTSPIASVPRPTPAWRPEPRGLGPLLVLVTPMVGDRPNPAPRPEPHR